MYLMGITLSYVTEPYIPDVSTLSLTATVAFPPGTLACRPQMTHIHTHMIIYTVVYYRNVDYLQSRNSFTYTIPDYSQTTHIASILCPSHAVFTQGG